MDWKTTSFYYLLLQVSYYSYRIILPVRKKDQNNLLGCGRNIVKSEISSLIGILPICFILY